MRTCMLIMSILLASAVLKAQPLVVYTSEELDPRSDKYCPYCVFKVSEAERQARERETTDAAWDALRRFDRLRERSRSRQN